MALTDEERQILRYAEQNTPHSVIYDETGMTATRYTQRLRNLLGRRDALEASPVLVNRLRRLADKVDQRREARR